MALACSQSYMWSAILLSSWRTRELIIHMECPIELEGKSWGAEVRDVHL